jgi:hypothetical protein
MKACSNIKLNLPLSCMIMLGRDTEEDVRGPTESTARHPHVLTVLLLGFGL